MRALGLDIGARRIGVAVSDPLGKTARPLTVLSPKQLEGKELQSILSEYQVEEIVIGMPTTMKGEAGEAAAIVQETAGRLRRRFHLPVKTYDERLTTVMAESALAQAGVDREKRKDKVDMVAAALILQGYLDNKASKAG